MTVLDLPYVTVEPHELDGYRVDRSGLPATARPLAVARPTSVAQVQEVLRHASAHGIPVTTRGAGTGLAGGAVASGDGIVLDLTALDRIESIDAVDQIAVVGPGVVTADLDAAAAAHGLRYAPDPASAAVSTVGGNIATNAGGLRCLKYGVTRDAVRSLDVVLADGRLVHLGAATTKSVVGYDLARLIVGSEGTLGVVVRATVSLVPLPVRTATAVGYFDSVAAAARAVAAIGATGVRPAVAELIDRRSLAAIDELRGSELSGRGEALLLVQTDGFGAEEEIGLVAGVLREQARDVTVTDDPVLAAELLAVRRDALPAIEARGRVLIEDIAVPVSRLAEAFDRVAEVSARTGVPIFTFAHAGDGNLHPIVLVEPSLVDPADPDRVPDVVREAADEVFALALALGGSVSGEHGVGLLKRAWLERELDPVALELQRGVRALFDPAGILNPGKAL